MNICFVMLQSSCSVSRDGFIFEFKFITKTRPCNIQQYFTAEKCSFSDEFFKYFFLIFAQNIACGYMLEPPQ